MASNGAHKKRSWEDYERELSLKRIGGGNQKKKQRQTPECIMVQRMSSEASGRAKKYERLDTHDFVDFRSFHVLSLENVKTACERFYDAPVGSCDVLHSDRGPSCNTTEQIQGKKVFYVRFVSPARAKNSLHGHHTVYESTGTGELFTYTGAPKDEAVGVVSSREASSTLSSLPQVPSSSIPNSVSLADLLKARKLVKPKKQVTTCALYLETYNIPKKQWQPLMESSIQFAVANEKFAEGGFREAFMATPSQPGLPGKWVIKMYRNEKIQSITDFLNISLEDHTRNQVQMHSVAQSIAFVFRKKAPHDFGKTFSYHKVYFSILEGEPVTVEQFIEGAFRKYINNTGLVSIPESEDVKEIYDKAECFSHFSYSETRREMMILDIQGAGYELCDPEIATTSLTDDDGGDEFFFCAGNTTLEGINTFLQNHKCNIFCEKMSLLPECIALHQ